MEFTEEQIEALAAFLFEREHGLEWDTEAGDDHDYYRRGAREILATPAVQAIIQSAYDEGRESGLASAALDAQYT